MDNSANTNVRTSRDYLLKISCTSNTSLTVHVSWVIYRCATAAVLQLSFQLKKMLTSFWVSVWLVDFDVILDHSHQ